MQLSTPHPDGPFLLGFAVFLNRQKSDNVRSFQIYIKESYLHTIKQELLKKESALVEMCAPIHYACVWEGAASAKEYMELITTQQRRAGWQCLLDFCTRPPRSSQTESELLLANAWSIANALFINANNPRKNCTINWERFPCIFPSIFACLKETESFEQVVSSHTSEELTDEAAPRLQVDLWQQWGSDLELASPKLCGPFELPLLKNHSNNESNSAYGDTESSLSSSLSSNNADMLLPWTMQTGLRQSPKIATIMTGTPSEETLGVNGIGEACTLFSPQSSFETLLRESSADCNIFANVLPFDLNQIALVNAVDLPNNNEMNGYYDDSTDCVICQPMSSASNTYNSGDERGLEAENVQTSDCLRELKVIGVKKAKSNVKLGKGGSSRAGSGKISNLTKAELMRYFHVPITQASKELNVGLTVLKKRCRIFGIPRWPHRKMKSINGLIQNIQDLVKTDTSGDDTKDSDQIQVAVEELEKQKKEMQECPSIQLPEKTKRLRQACFKASYRKRRQARNDYDAHDDNEHQNAPAHVSYNSGSIFFYPHCDLRVGAPFCPK